MLNKKYKKLLKIIKNNLFCRCLHYFSSNEKLETHAVDYGGINDCAIRLSNENDK